MDIPIKIKTMSNASVLIMTSKCPNEVRAALALAKRQGLWLIALQNERIRFQAEFIATWTGRIPELIELMRTNFKTKRPPTTLEDVVEGGYTRSKLYHL